MFIEVNMLEILLSGKEKKGVPSAAAIDNATFSAAPGPGYGFHFAPVTIGTRIYHFGYYNGSGQATARYFDTATGTFTAIASLPTTVYGAAAIHYEGKVYIIGGTRGDGTFTTIIYNIATNTYSRGTTALPSLVFFGAAVKDNLVYIAGANNTGNLYIYNVLTDTFETVSLGVPAQNGGSASIVGDYLYVFGGRNASLVHQTTAYRVHLTTRLVEQLTPLPKALMITWSRFVYGKYIVFVGTHESSSASSFTHGFFYYDTDLDSYKVLATPNSIRSYAWSGFVNDTFYMLGGIVNSTGLSDSIKLSLAI